jgi:pimeloyl-ACP methyl ester carboxylesterase
MLKTTQFKKGTVAFSDTGKGKVVVLLHGFLGSHLIWKNTVDYLSASFRVIAIDLPGHGKTDSFGYVHTMDLMAKCVKSVMDSLGLKKYVIVGHSMGGYVALAFADLFPDNVRGLCLFHSTAYADSDQKKKDRTRSIKVVKGNHSVYTDEVIKNLFAPTHVDSLKNEVDFAQRIASQTSQQSIIAALEGMKDRPNRDVILGMAPYHIMMIIGRLDNVLSANDLLEQAELIQKKHILLLENDGHMGFLESSEVTNLELKKFVVTCFR